MALELYRSRPGRLVKTGVSIIHHLQENTPPSQHGPHDHPQTSDPKPPTNLLCPLGIRVRLTCHILIVLLISGESICVLALERGELIVWDVLLCCEFGVAVYLNADFG
jgi:hypothetical protein